MLFTNGDWLGCPVDGFQVPPSDYATIGPLDADVAGNPLVLHCNHTSGTGSLSAGLVIADSTHMTVSSLVVQGATAGAFSTSQPPGGAFSVINATNVTLDGVGAVSCSGRQAGAIFVGSQATVSVVNAEVRDCNGTTGGGVVVNGTRTSVLVSTSFFNKATSEIGGGALAAYNRAHLVVRSCNVSFCDGALAGGVFVGDTGSRLTIEGGDFFLNRGGCGPFYCSSSSFFRCAAVVVWLLYVRWPSTPSCFGFAAVFLF